MALNLGTTAIGALYLGSRAISTAYLGSVQVYDAGGAAFDPVSLFAFGEEGALFLPGPTTSFLSTTDLTPAGAGDTVGFQLDTSQGAGYSGGSFTGLGSELVTNGTFDTDASDWIVGNVGTTITVSSGVATVANSTVNYGYVYQSLTTVAGRTYVVSGVTSAGGIELRNSTASGTIIVSTGELAVFTALSSTTILKLGLGLAPDSRTFDNISVRELPGNHATQTNPDARPVLARVPSGGRRNLLERTEEFDNAYWVKENVSVTADAALAPDGTTTADTLTDNAASAEHRIYRINVTDGASKQRPLSVSAKAGTANFISVSHGNTGEPYAVFDLSSGTVSSQFNCTASVTPESNGFYRCEVSSPVASQSDNFVINIGTTAAQATPGATYVGAGDTVYIWGAQLEEASTASAYQKVVSEYDVTEAGVDSLWYLDFDGVDDTLVLPNIPFNSDTGFNAFMAADTTGLAAGAMSAIGRTSSATVDSYGAYFGGGTNYAPSVFDQQTLANVDERFRAIGAATQRKAVFSWQASLTNTNERTAVVCIDQTETTEVYTKDNLATSEVFNALCSVEGVQFSNVKIYSALIRCAAPLTAQEISDTKTFLADRSGVTL